jgi:hypothetical protein
MIIKPFIMKHIKFALWAIYKIFVYNPIIFIWGCITNGIPLWRWPSAWVGLSELEEKRIAKTLNDMAMRGEILRRIDDEGCPVYYPLGYFDEKQK